MSKKIKPFFVWSMYFALTWFVIQTIFIVSDGLNDEVKHSDVAIVLGNKVNINGEPSERLKARLDKALELYNKGYFNYVIVSGGIGKEGFDEAKVMKQYLIENGIKEDKVIADSKGYNTFMTAKNAVLIAKDMDFDSVILITQYFHITRTELAFRKVGFEEISSAHAEIFEFRDIYSTIREFPAFYKYLLVL